jgi:hypothetical protein
MPAPINRAAILAEIASSLASGQVGGITAAQLQSVLNDTVNSVLNLVDENLGTTTGTGGTSYAYGSEFFVSIKAANILTTGTGDIGSVSIPLPAGTRWFLASGYVFTETKSGTLTGDTIAIYDAPSAGGNLMSGIAAGPINNNANQYSLINSTIAPIFSTSSTAYFRQTASAGGGSGTLSAYLYIKAIP